jgi:hypothetical protein
MGGKNSLRKMGEFLGIPQRTLSLLIVLAPTMTRVLTRLPSLTLSHSIILVEESAICGGSKIKILWNDGLFDIKVKNMYAIRKTAENLNDGVVLRLRNFFLV